MALGQLVGGAVSDQRGRRRPLLAAVVAMTVASVVCALTPMIGVMMVARLVQGFAGGWAMVIGRAVIVDLATGAHLVRVLNVIPAVGGVAPIIGPLLGAVILVVSGSAMGALFAYVATSAGPAGSRPGRSSSPAMSPPSPPVSPCWSALSGSTRRWWWLRSAFSC